jgi:hypothetical protein
MNAKSQVIGKTLLVLLLLLLPGVSSARYSGGTGEPNDHYRIATPNDLNDIGNHIEDYNKCFVMTADINLADYSGTQFNIIGDFSNPFIGVFDGNGHAVSNFTYISSGSANIGLFGCLFWPGAVIKGLGLINPRVDGGTGWYVGSLVGRLFDGAITGCYAQGGSVSNSDWYVGGLVGASAGTISHCYATCSVSGERAVGGLVGYNMRVVRNCYSTGHVEGSSGIGGLVGRNYATEMTTYFTAHYGTVSNCYATGTVSGYPASLCMGGLVGDNDGTIFNSYAKGSVSGTQRVGGLAGAHRGEICQCYSTGGVSGTAEVGGLVAFTSGGVVVDSFWDVNSSKQATSAGGMGKTTAQMQEPNTFTDGGWDFVNESDGPSDIWAEPVGGGYPILWWQLSSLPPLPSFSGGSGQASDPYLISTAEELNHIGQNPRLMEARFQLSNSIDLTGIDFFIIGNKGNPYAGVFDGNGKTISNFAHNSTGRDCIGLFGVIEGPNAQCKDLGLIDVSVDAGTGSMIGSLVGWLKYGDLAGCYVRGASVFGDKRVGGLVGYSYLGDLAASASSGTVSGTTDVGGLVGDNREATISESYSSCSVAGHERVGGLAGHNLGDSWWFICHFAEIYNCYSVGSVDGTSDVGGLVGYNNCNSELFNCYSAGSVLGTTNVGGLVGYDIVGYFTKCFWDNTVSPLLTGIGTRTDPNVIAQSTTEMKRQSTFTDAGWDFVGETANGTEDIWAICQRTNYPRLAWQIPAADFLCPDGVNFIDYAYFTDVWNTSDPNADLDLSGLVDPNDLKIFCDHWLEGL